MDPAGQNYPNSAQNSRPQLFHSSQLPLPSQSASRSTILPPLANISPSIARFPVLSSQSSLPPLPSPNPSIHNSWQNLPRHDLRFDPPVKRESIHHNSQSSNMPPPHTLQDSKDPESSSHPSAEDGMPTTSDFVKKLYKMLEDQSFQHVVSWGPQGDCFVVKDMNEFTKSILPRMFKHSNFASFVRQLNKYDFHKVKNTDDNQFGEHSWMFRHPDFHANRRDALENIKRKVPTQRKQTNPSTSRPLSSTSPGPYPTSSSVAQHQIESLQGQVERLTQSQEEMASRIRNLERNYQDVLVEMVGFQRNMAQQDSLMQNLIQYFLQIENGKSKNAARIGASNNTSTVSDQNPFLPTQEAQRMMGSYPESDVARASLVQMSQISKRAEVAGLSFGMDGGLMGSTSNNATTSSGSNNNGNGSIRGRGMDRPSSRIWAAAANAGLTRFDGPGEGNASSGKSLTRQEALAQIEELQRNRPTNNEPRSFGSFSGGGMGPGPSSFNASSEDSMDEEVVMPSQPPPEIRTPESGRSSASNASRPGASIGAWGSSSTPDGNETSPGSHQGLQVYTVGHLMPKSSVDDTNGNWSFDASSLAMLSGFPGLIPQPQGQSSNQGQEGDNTGAFNNNNNNDGRSYSDSNSPSSSASQTSSPGSSSTKPKLTVRRSTFVPGWAVPPRVLLVDDDAVSRKLSSKFLQVFGCTIDVAMDGVAAVNKMNLEKYDLVLMDIVMPKLDGVSATSLIRKFDHMTPIISMTSNSKPNDIMTYYSSGMNDILPKPFTKEGLLDMLEKHLMHLKVIQQMARVPRSVGIPPLSDNAFEQALTSQAAVMSGPGNSGNSTLVQVGDSIGFSGLGDNDGRINPLAGMGLTDEQYNTILQNLVNGESFSGAMGMNMSMSMGESVSGGEKRSLDDTSDGREGKRSRFEVIE